ncbi:sce7726 family protein [Hyphomicrobium zavarzinii]|uniref:sce7726 family protein n=1 Tax=Hyphomicrobium zavarzinii TaxID=48292 RepID=UPI000368309D|nr:sce7726 family protein [Hyphomicrobium zavarzinii]
MPRPAPINDAVIRAALHHKRLRQHKGHPDTIVIDELGLAHAKSRIDVAVINGCIHGYEIKSDADTLERLGSQIDIYSRTLQKLTIVASTRHLDAVARRAPDWCGIIEAYQGVRQAIHLRPVRPARSNPGPDAVMIAHLLWRSEAAGLLQHRGYTPKQLRAPRRQLYEMLCEEMTLAEITTAIRLAMVSRKVWRDLPAHA